MTDPRDTAALVARLQRRMHRLGVECHTAPGETTTDRAASAAALMLDLQEAARTIDRLTRERDEARAALAAAREVED